MKAKRFGFFFSIKDIDKDIGIYRQILKILKNVGLDMYNPELISDYPNSLNKIRKDGSTLVEGTQRQLRSVDFCVAYFTRKSRFVFLQTIMSLENKTPVLCLIQEDRYTEFPESLISYGEDFVQVRKYKDDNELPEIIREYVEDLEPPKRRFNVVLKTKTLKQMEQLSRHLDVTKAEILRRVIDKEYRRTFD